MLNLVMLKGFKLSTYINGINFSIAVTDKLKIKYGSDNYIYSREDIIVLSDLQYPFTGTFLEILNHDKHLLINKYVKHSILDYIENKRNKIIEDLWLEQLKQLEMR